MSDVPWEQLPEDTIETCNYPVVAPKKDGETIKGEILRSFGTPCGVKAKWIKRDTCGCGAVHMFQQYCAAHQEAYLAEKKATEEWGKRNVVHEILPGGIVRATRRKDQKDK